MLASRAIAYLNVDISVFGPGGLMPRATPQLDELIKEASRMVFKHNTSFLSTTWAQAINGSMQLHNRILKSMSSTAYKIILEIYVDSRFIYFPCLHFF